MVAEVVLDGVLGDGGEAVLRVWELPAGQAAGALAESLPAVLRFAVGGLGAARVRWPGATDELAASCGFSSDPRAQLTTAAPGD
ncbi:hypothetical protein ACFQ34_24900 [Pseudonocardia benzenivorans]|jgi:hypothetical protein|uniref:Uncharacterized protein n=2 Tax=Pseudonocardia TaxID=1847 RepID=F4CTH9_PSEUX|nr:hypothetical protein [Pseudonocardia dioxanivorans]AEA27404.1 hypothetical protein Psed_5270 [Pseudonocardia dioxanivorans CB1190]GJF06982.1 hypothetical protein PSD17_59290 [Pseudonocardia sp. D17]